MKAEDKPTNKMAPQPGNSGPRPDTGNKRKDVPQAQGAGRAFKRVKVQDARSIRSQPADAALKDGELDLQAFLNARQFEIGALQDGMRKSKALNNRRAFQLVPREMRRRTASHNVKKLPKRLRNRARWEQLQDNTPTVVAGKRKPKTTRARIRLESAKRLGILAEKKRKRKLREAKSKAKAGGGSVVAGEKEESSAAFKQLIETRPARPKIRRNLLNDPPKPRAKFRKRQIEKTWLPTHLWHAKRARMTPPKEPLWRFAIPLTPNEKVYRTTHRASSAQGAVAWDMSYMSTIGLYGHASGVERTLRSLGLSHDSLWDDRGKKWREGRRKWSGTLSKQTGGDARRQIGPATVIWNPESDATQGLPPGVAEADPSKTPEKAQRQLYIRLHPSCFLEVFNILVALNKREQPRLYVEDLRFEIGSIELIGPGATEVLSGVIASYHSKENSKEAHAKQFEALAASSNAAAPPSDILLGFSAQDPRLRYPPRTVPAQISSEEQTNGFCALQHTSDEAKPAPFLLFDRDARFKASSFPSQKSLNRRKGSNPPGQPLTVTAADSPFPVVLFASRGVGTKHSRGSWTLLAPCKCISPIWYSLVHYPMSTGGNPKVGGLDELRQVTFEQGLPWFPGDFPGTNAGADWEVEQRAKRKADWVKRPKSKRVAWESLDLGAGRKGEIGTGWACEFERLFGLQQPEEHPSTKNRDQNSDGVATKDPENKDKMDVDGGEARSAQDDTSGTGERESAVKRQSPKAPASHPLTLINHLSKYAFNTLVSATSNQAPPPYSIVTVKVAVLGRGVAGPCARIYRLPARKDTPLTPATQPEVPATQPPSQVKGLPADLRDQWLAQIHGTSTNRHSSSEKKGNQPRRFPAGADFDTQKLLLAQTLLTNTAPFPPEKVPGGSGDHPLVPGEEDLIGYVTKGEFCLAQGQAMAIGSVSVERVLEALRNGGEKEGRICVVRNAGEQVGWVARWDLV